MTHKQILFTLSCICILSACQKEQPLQVERLAFTCESVDIQLEKYSQVFVYAINGNDTTLMENADLQWSASDKSVINVYQGVIYAKSEGKSVLTASYSDKQANVTVTVRDGVTTTGIDARFAESKIIDLGHHTGVASGIQSFDLDKDGNIFYIQVGAGTAYYEDIVTKLTPSKVGSVETISSMKFYYLGHPTSFAIENGEDGQTYLWSPEFASKVTSAKSANYKEYWSAQAIARVKYMPGTVLYPWDPAIEYFYFGNSGDINVALDIDNDILCVTYHISTYLGETRRVFTYSLSEAMALPLVDQELEITYGGDGAPEAIEKTEKKTVKVHDCRTLTPLGHMGIPTDKRDGINTYDWQGFEYHDGLVYFVEGTSYLSMGGSRCALTIFNMDGSIHEDRNFVRVVQDPEELKTFNITTTGAIEAEGVKVKGDDMYMAFASNGFMGLSQVRANIFKYKKAE